MSVKSIQEKVRLFLKDKDRRTLCMRGKWGVGKTHTWKEELQHAVNRCEVAEPRYSYVSLFGVNSLSELKLAIFENSEKLKAGRPIAIHQVEGQQAGRPALRQWLRTVKGIPGIGNAVGISEVTSILTMSSIRNHIICIDDLERKGKGLSVQDVLGLISYLREQRACRLVLLLNDEELHGEQSNELEAGFEKVIDVHLRLEPTPEEAASLVREESGATILPFCIALGITNIRVFAKIARFAAELERELCGVGEEIKHGIMKSIALAGWRHYLPREAPTQAFFDRINSWRYDDYSEWDDLSKKEQEWYGLLKNFGHFWNTDLDDQLFKGVKDGILDLAKVRELALRMDQETLAGHGTQAVEFALSDIFSSFADNERELLDSLYNSFNAVSHLVSVYDLERVSSVFRALGHVERAKHVIELYFERYSTLSDEIRRRNAGWMKRPGDAEICEKLRLEQTKEVTQQPLDVLLKNSAKVNNEVELEVLCSISEEDYYRAFKNAKDDDLSALLSAGLDPRLPASRATLQPRRPHPIKSEIVAKVRRVLNRIAGESRINELRVVEAIRRAPQVDPMRAKDKKPEAG